VGRVRSGFFSLYAPTKSNGAVDWKGRLAFSLFIFYGIEVSNASQINIRTELILGMEQIAWLFKVEIVQGEVLTKHWVL
jgi:hypothetical protein